MNKRERILLFVVLGIAGSYAMFLVVKSAFLGPLETQATQIRNLTSEIASKQKLMDEANKANTQLAEWEKTCLPGDEATAQSLYQDFLYRLCRDSKFEGGLPEVNPEKIQKYKYSMGIPFTIRGKITLENLTDFLYRFYEPNLMHQVRSIDISRDSTGKSLSVIIRVAGLAINEAPDRKELIPEAAKSGGPLLAGLSRDNFKLITQKNIFEPHRDPPPAITAREPEVDAAKFVVLSGLPHIGNGPEAWLYNRLTHENRVLREGDEFEIVGVKGKIVSVSRTGIVFEMDNKQWSLKLGKMLREMKEVAKPGAVASEPAAYEKPVEKTTEKPPADSAEGAPKGVGDSGDAKPAKVGEKIQSEKIPTEPDAEANKAGAGS
jgi:hypothetical protein